MASSTIQRCQLPVVSQQPCTEPARVSHVTRLGVSGELGRALEHSSSEDQVRRDTRPGEQFCTEVTSVRRRPLSGAAVGGDADTIAVLTSPWQVARADTIRAHPVQRAVEWAGARGRPFWCE